VHIVCCTIARHLRALKFWGVDSSISDGRESSPPLTFFLRTPSEQSYDCNILIDLVRFSGFSSLSITSVGGLIKTPPHLFSWQSPNSFHYVWREDCHINKPKAVISDYCNFMRLQTDRLAQNHFLSVARAYLDSLVVPRGTQQLGHDELNTVKFERRIATVVRCPRLLLSVL